MANIHSRRAEAQFAPTISAVACALLFACATTTDGGRDDSRSVTLGAARINAGETGRAMLIPLGERTQVTIVVSGVPRDVVSRPVHLYTFIYTGSCGNLPAQPSYALNERVLADSPASSAVGTAGGPLTIANVAPVPIGALYGGGYAIRVMTSPVDGNREIFCGDIR